MGALKLAFFFIGTLAFFAAVYFSIKHPELVESPGQEKQEINNDSIQKWDRIASWIMWGGWGCAAILTFLDRGGYLDVAE